MQHTPGPARPALPAVRLRLIEDTVRSEGFARTAQVAARFGTSEVTARRDLDRLAGAGPYTRVHGGLVLDRRHDPATATVREVGDDGLARPR